MSPLYEPPHWFDAVDIKNGSDDIKRSRRGKFDTKNS